MTFGFTQRRLAKLPLRPTVPKVEPQAVAERLPCACLGVSFLLCWIAAEPCPRVQLLGLLAGRHDAHRGIGAESQTACAAVDGVLEDPCALTAFADAQSPAGNDVIEPDFVALAGRQSKSTGRFN